MKKPVWWKLLVATVWVLLPGSMLLLPLVVAAWHRQRIVGREIEIVQGGVEAPHSAATPLS